MFPEGSYLTEEMQRQFNTDGTWRNIDLYQYLEQAIIEKPEEIAVVSYKEEDGRQTSLTYAELGELVNRLAAGLTSMGVGKGDVVSVQMPNWWEFAVICFATFKIGAVINGLTPIYRHKEVSFIMGLTESKVVFIPRLHRNFNYVDMFRELSPTLPSLKKIIVVEESDQKQADDNVITFYHVLNSGDTNGISDIHIDPNQLAQLGFTSGTTGEPKGVMHTHNTLEATVRNFVLHEHLEKGGKNLVVSPVGHQTGFLWGTVMTVFLQGTIVYLDVWKAERALQIMHEQQITMMVAAYPFVHDIATLEGIESRRPTSLKFISVPGAPIPRRMVRICSDFLDCVVSPAWGMTEYGIAIAAAPHDPPSGYLTDGRLVPGASARIVDEEGNEVQIGEEGNLQIMGAGLFIGYYKRPETTKANFRDGIWFETGDRVIKSAKGFVSITGRTKDIIIRGGENIPVAEIENLLFQWEKVKDVAIVAMPDDRLGERACAYIVPTEQFSFEEMIQYLLSTGIAKQKLPERLELIDELPRTASGKVQKFLLRNDVKAKLQQVNASK